MKEFYTINEICDRWGVTRPTVYRLMRDKKLAWVVIGHRRRVRAEVLLAYEQQEEAA